MITIIVAVLTAALVERGYSAYKWKRKAETALSQGETSFKYLSEPITTDEKGNKFSRAQVIDVLVKDVVTRSAIASIKAE